MKQARIMGRVQNSSNLAIQDAEGQKHLFKRGATLPQEACERSRHSEPTIAVHADIMGYYPVADMPKFLFDYDGDELPRELNIRDGGDTGYHAFEYAGPYVEE